MFLTHIFGSNWPIYKYFYVKFWQKKLSTLHDVIQLSSFSKHVLYSQREGFLCATIFYIKFLQFCSLHVQKWVSDPCFTLKTNNLLLGKQSPNSPGTENINRQANPKNHQRTDQKRDWPLRQTRQNLPPEGRGSFVACSLRCSKNNEKIYTMTWNFVQTSCKAWI